MSHVRITDVTADGSTLSGSVYPSRDLERFFAATDFRTTYDVSIADVPPGVLSIPILAQVCPVAWANGADVYVDEIDDTFAQSLGAVNETLASLHEFIDTGTVYATQTTDSTSNDSENTRNNTGNVRDDSGNAGLLFTGGVDSTCSYVRHRDEEPILISIRGWTITPAERDDETWETVKSRVETFGRDRDLETAFCESNFFSVLDHPMLLAHYKRYVDGGWYSSVGHGIGLLGLCAPLAYARGIDDLYVAATHWEGIELEWGSRPDIDNRVRWANTSCHHDGYELTRQERIETIAAYARETDVPLTLQTCNDQFDGNCGQCEKCYRTAIGLELAGLDANAFGYPFDHADYPAVRDSFEHGRWVLGQDERYMWEDIRNHARDVEPTSPEEREFFTWLEQTDLEELVDHSGQPVSHRLLRAGVRNTPVSVYNALYPAWTAAKTGLQTIRSR